MDLRVYYQRMRKIEQDIANAHVVIVSLETSDGGKPGVKTEVTREGAARLIVETRARLGSKEESDEFYKLQKDLLTDWEQSQAARRLDLRLVSDDDGIAIKRAVRKREG